MLIMLAQIGAAQPGGQEDFEICKANQGGSLEEMMAACGRVIDNKVLDKASLAVRVRAFRIGDAARAIGDLDQAIALNPDNSIYYSEGGIKYG